jgi:PAS domain S-box-containing protein
LRVTQLHGHFCHIRRTLSCPNPFGNSFLAQTTPRPHKASESANAEIEAAQRLAAIVESSDDAIVSKDLNGIIKSWNRGAERIFGYTAEEAIGKSITIVIPPELRDQEPLILSRIAKGERIERFETVRERKDGTQFHVSLTVSPVRDPEGRIIGASKIARDISDLRRSQERQELLLREMNHRVKNLFAVASGVVALSSRSAKDAKELASTVQARLSALSRAHELILPRNEETSTTSLRDLVHIILAPYESSSHEVVIEGPEVACGPGATTSFALLLHEFATNAVKYGAFAHSGARLQISWMLSEDTLRFRWSEANVPGDRKAPAGSGFGSFLVDATMRGLSAELRRNCSDDTFTIDMRVPLDKLRA